MEKDDQKSMEYTNCALSTLARECQSPEIRSLMNRMYSLQGGKAIKVLMEKQFGMGALT